MLSQRQILQTLRSNLPLLKKFGVNEIGLFGSYTRQEQTKVSDIDILVSFEPGKTTWDNYFALCTLLDSLFEGNNVEVVSKETISPYLTRHILPTVQYV